MSHGLERIGKKYQWIALQELLARLADNYHWDSFNDSGENLNYHGTWQLSIRDIDPSCLLEGKEANEKICKDRWWNPKQYYNWKLADEKKILTWLKDKSDLPEWPSLVNLKSIDGEEWLLMDGLFEFKSPIPSYDYTMEYERGEVWYWFHSYLVKKINIPIISSWLKKQEFSGRWMPEPPETHNIFLGEWYWSPAYKFIQCPYYNYPGWAQDGRTSNETIPVPVHLTAENYIRESSCYDYSIENSIHLTLPSKPILDGMNLTWNGNGGFIMPNGELAVQSPTDDDKGRRSLLIKKKPFINYLKENDLTVLWTILGEKNHYFPNFQERWLGRLEFSGSLLLKNEKLINTFNSKFTPPPKK